MRLSTIIGTRTLLLLAVAACASTPSSSSRVGGGIPAATGAPRDMGGIRVLDMTIGAGRSYAPRHCIYTHYTGWLADGTRFDASRDPVPDGRAGEPVVFVQGAKRVMNGWETGFEGMRVGGTRRLFVPWRLAYGAKGNPPVIPPRADLVFDVELMAIADTLPHASATAASCPTWAAVTSR